ncbi:MAG: class I SAM-dependent methyltransferase [Planctomycetia bacterium]
MNTSSAACPEPAHDPEEATRWFDQWHVYRAIVDADWMAHRAIFHGVRAWVLLRHPGPFTLVDLGCGDAGFIKHTFDATGLWAYTGVDASTMALSKARDELAGARFRTQFVEADMLAHLRRHSSPDATTSDVILASYAVHHLPAREKQEFFRLAHGALAGGGSLLLADIFRRGEETREEYLAAYVGMMRQGWKELPPEGLASTVEHVTQRDFPETTAAIATMAREAGFCGEPQELFHDATGFHRLFALTKSAAS